MKPKIEEILDILLREVKRGKSIEDCLKDYPEYVDELEPLLRLATSLQDLPKPEPRQEAVVATLRNVKDAVVEKTQKKIKFSLRKIFRLQPAVIRAVAAVVLVVVLGWTTVTLSAHSLPEDVLYPVKRLTERIQYILTITPEGKAELHIVFAHKRTDEFAQSFEEGEEMNRPLLNAMLNEAQSALKYSESLPEERVKQLVEKIMTCNHHQREILEKIKPLACSSDSPIIDEAINLCAQRHRCIEYTLNPELYREQPSSTCWDQCCDWK
ncbi:MAG: hypothetical protein JSV97_04290 [candidate division WOR-3 bacterium]|nr:MAG: hypothetical protein JSV97_04290 [candidate division WOR-3 bacterium]